MTTPSRCSICRPSSNCTTLQMHIKVPSFFLSFLLPRHSSSFIGAVCQLRCRATTGSSFRGLQTSPSRCSICRPSSNCTTLQMHIKVPSFFLSFLLPRHSSSFIDTVWSVAVSSNNRFIVSGSEDKSIKVFDLQTKQQLHHFADAHQGTIILSFLSSTPPLILFHRASKVSCGVERQQVHRFGV